MTWLLVSTRPFEVRTMPVPSAVASLYLRSEVTSTRPGSTLVGQRGRVQRARAGVGAAGAGVAGAAGAGVAVARGQAAETVSGAVSGAAVARAALAGAAVSGAGGDRGRGAGGVVERDGGARAGAGRDHRDRQVGERPAEAGSGRRVAARRTRPTGPGRNRAARSRGLRRSQRRRRNPGPPDRDPVGRRTRADRPATRWVAGAARRVPLGSLAVDGAADRTLTSVVGGAAAERDRVAAALGVVFPGTGRGEPGAHVLRWLPAALLRHAVLFVVHLLAFTMTSVRGVCPAAASCRPPLLSSKPLKPESKLKAG